MWIRKRSFERDGDDVGFEDEDDQVDLSDDETETSGFDKTNQINTFEGFVPCHREYMVGEENLEDEEHAASSFSSPRSLNVPMLREGASDDLEILWLSMSNLESREGLRFTEEPCLKS